MARWTSGAKERLQAAAFDAISRRGFDAVTVAEIAADAGVTERTFFRYFTDKREVLFAGQAFLVDAAVGVIHDAGEETEPVALVRAALGAVAELFPPDRRAHSRARGAIIASDPALVEREAQKMRALSSVITDALRARGTADPEASLVAQSSVGVFEIAFREWIAEGEHRDLGEIQDSLFDRLGALLAPGTTPAG